MNFAALPDPVATARGSDTSSKRLAKENPTLKLVSPISRDLSRHFTHQRQNVPFRIFEVSQPQIVRRHRGHEMRFDDELNPREWKTSYTRSMSSTL
jgi:hypothetical protein